MVEELIRNGVESFCISSGSRSSPLTMAVANNPKAKSLIHFDERANAFRALGISSTTQKPTAVITTSGTAAANIFPAVIEASKKKVPLIILTADRPPELRFTGAHQTIDQIKIYSDYVRWYFDLPCPTEDISPEFVLTTIDQAISRAKGNPGGPAHINCMYREPLVGAGLKPAPTYRKAIQHWIEGNSPYTQYIPSNTFLDQKEIKNLVDKIKKIKTGIIVVGKLSTTKERQSVLKLAQRLNWPVFPDISSGLRNATNHKNVIHYFDQILLSNLEIKPDGILHFGGRITSKRWYEYVETLAPEQYIMTISHPLRNDPLHNVTTRIQSEITSVSEALTKQLPQRGSNVFLPSLQKKNSCVHQTIDGFFEKQTKLSEPQTARLITETIAAHSGLFIASSMPIRDIDMYSKPDKNPFIFGANRGASGIDGTIATAAGFSTGLNTRTTLLIGDLAFLYDLNALAMLRDLKHPMTIVLLNNNGGGIFSFLPINAANKSFEKYFGTPHHLTFNAAAELFNLNYAQTQTADEFVKTYAAASSSQRSTVIEIQTDRTENVKIHQQLQNLIKNNLHKTLMHKTMRSKNDKKYTSIRKTVNLDNSRKLRRYQVR